MQQQRLTPQQANPRIEKYCAYQERCHSEVREKLYSFGLNKNEVDEAVSRLIEGNFLNEERFALQFARGKFRIRQWGKIKIRYELKSKQVSDYCIRKALSALDTEAYDNTLQRLAELKFNSLKGEKNSFVKRKKLSDYLRQKGYEPDLVNDLVKAMIR